MRCDIHHMAAGDGKWEWSGLVRLCCVPRPGVIRNCLKNRRGEEYLFKHQDKILEKVFIKVADHFILHDLEGFESGDLLLVGAH